MTSRILFVALLALTVVCTACPPPLLESLCGRRATAGGEIQDAKDCSSGFRCEFEPAPASSGDVEWGVCRRVTDSGPVVTDASTEGGVVDGARDGGSVDRAGVDAARADVAGQDLLGVDVTAGDTATADAQADPCVDAGCGVNTTCAAVDGGGHTCLCGSAPCTGATPDCVADQSVDGGAGVICCATGASNCGGVCVDTQSSSEHCGSCGSACTGRAEGSLCVGGSCGCDPSADAGGVCPVGAGAHPAVVSCDSVDGGSLGRCTYTCDGQYLHCTGSDPKECETDTHSDDQHCGSCTSKARLTVTVNDAGVLISNRCVGGEKVCGSENDPCTGTVGGTGCYEPGGEGDVGATCKACWTAEAPLCGGLMCCHGGCVNATSEDKSLLCGCAPEPDGVKQGDNCEGYTQGGGVDTAGRAGKVCVDADGVEVARTGLSGGSCGCHASGTAACASTSYNNDNQSSSVTLGGVCNPTTHGCEAQTRSSCGIYGGVSDTAGHFVSGASCHPLYGGPVCESPDSNGLGNCGCGSWSLSTGIDKNTACQAPVTTDRAHVVASTCTSSLCTCFNSSGGSHICDPLSTDGPDCCEGDGCTNLETDENNCGVCTEACGTSQKCGDETEGLAPGQCSCTAGTCPLEGGGGGPNCSNSKCVCSNAGSKICKVGTWCMTTAGGDVLSGIGNGCCERKEENGANRCPVNSYCSAGNPVLCVNSTASNSKYLCCPEGSPCGLDSSGANVTCTQ